MEGIQARTPAPTAENDRAWFGADWRLLLLVLVLAGGIRVWVICRTEVISRDSIIFINYAVQLEREPWAKVVRGNHQHPGYPATILAVSQPVRWLSGTTDAAVMQLSAQLASALAGWLLVFPMFYLGKELFDRGVGFWATLLFQCLPISGLILSDALSEALFFLLVTTALLWCVRALKSGSWLGFAGCGALSGLAYVTRPEGAVVILAAGVLLLLMQLVRPWRHGWGWTLSRGTALVMPGLVVACPLPLVTGQFSPKPSFHQTIVKSETGQTEEAAVRAPQKPGGPEPAAVLTAGMGQHTLQILAVWLNKEWSLSRSMGQGFKGLATELVKGFHYIAWLPAVLGLFWHWQHLRRRPEVWLVLILCALFAGILGRLAVAAHYVSERHVLLLVLCGLYPAVVGLRDLPARLTAWRQARSAPLWSLALLLLMAGSGLPKTLAPLHANRAGHHEAGRWLAQHAGPLDEVLDGHFGWARFYSGRLFPGQGAIPQDHPPTLFIIKGRSLERRNPYGPNNSQADYTLQEIKAAGGQPAFCWLPGQSADQADVVIWAVRKPFPTVPVAKK